MWEGGDAAQLLGEAEKAFEQKCRSIPEQLRRALRVRLRSWSSRSFPAVQPHLHLLCVIFSSSATMRSLCLLLLLLVGAAVGAQAYTVPSESNGGRLEEGWAALLRV